MIENSEIYVSENETVNELKGFTKSFQKRSREKREEDANIKEIMNLMKEKCIVFGSKMCEKMFKRGKIRKVFLTQNCEELTKQKLVYYAGISKVECVLIDVDCDELGAKLSKPFLISVVSVVGSENV